MCDNCIAFVLWRQGGTGPATCTFLLLLLLQKQTKANNNNNISQANGKVVLALVVYS